MKKIVVIFFSISLFLFFLKCTINDSENTDLDSLNIHLRMEVLVLDSVTHIDPRRNTLAHFYTAIINDQYEVSNEEFSDMNTCPNGWAVKEYDFLLNQNEKILLGITTEDPEFNNYVIQDVTYRELAAKANGHGFVLYKKTFNIYE